MNPSNNLIARKNGLVVQEMPDEVLIYDLNSNKAHCLNSAAALVWRSCNGTNSIADIVREFETAGAGRVSEDFIWLAIDQLNEKDLLESRIPVKFGGSSRRQAIKAIGLGAVAALPVVASLMAPATALGSVSCACTSSAQCASLNCPSPVNCNPTGICAPNP